MAVDVGLQLVRRTGLKFVVQRIFGNSSRIAARPV
jgi:hypothetical protein